MDAQSESISGKPRLWAVIVGIDRYERLRDLNGAVRDARIVHDALRRTRMSATEVRSELVVTDGEIAPTRDTIVRVLSRVAAVAAQNDTVVIHLAGHGVIAGRAVSFVPEDGDPKVVGTLLTVEELQHLFDKCSCPRRALLLDMCQKASDTQGAIDSSSRGADGAANLAGHVDGRIPGQTRNGISYRSRGGMSSRLLEGLTLTGRGWTVLTSCGPDQFSLESEELGWHGIFSHYVALGLRGEADLDGDGTVGLGELAQYISNKVSWEANRASSGSVEQVPELICRGRIDPMTDPGGASIRSAPPERREFEWPEGLGRAWLGVFCGKWPFEQVTIWSWLVRGSALLYGAAMGLEVLLIADARSIAVLLTGVSVALVSCVLWYAVISFSIVSATNRYHHGGYQGAAAVVAWHLIVFAACIPLAVDIAHLIHFGVDVFFLLVFMIVFGVNALHIIINVFDLEKRREEGVLRDFFRELERKLMRAEFPNPLPCESFHPKVYLAVWPVITILLLVHMGMVLSKEPLSGTDGLVFLRDVIVWVLVSWFVSGNFAVYRTLFRRHPKQVKA
ncbi:MAG: caspase family protein [Phycisphaerales bacterium]|nr:MAG: caspase family protein [Phycisphaerales bacterium]